MIIDSTAFGEMITDLENAEPHEGCGLLAGPIQGRDTPCPHDTDGDGNCGRQLCPYCGRPEARDRICDRWVRMPNMAEFPQLRFEMDPGRLIQAWQALDGQERRPWIVAHSHPRDSAVPSLHDRRYATDPSLLHLVVSLAGPTPAVRLWRIDQAADVAVKVPFRVVDLGRKENPPTDLTQDVSGA